MMRHNTIKFWFGCVLASFICGPALYFAVTGMWHFLAPQTFWERLLSFMLVGTIGFGASVVDVFLWVFIASRFE